MKTTFIRIGLLLSALWLVFYNAKSFILAFSIHLTEDTSVFSSLMQAISNLMLGVPLVIILFWALYNLKPYAWLSPKSFAAFIKAVILIACVALFVSTSVYFVQSAPYLPNLSSSQFLTFIRSMDWLPYTLAELSLLGFAYVQLSSKAKGQNMSESEL